MDLYDEKLVKLENMIEQVRRRKIADFGQESFEYIDTDANVEKLKIYNNNIIEARRGCGKTSLILKVLEKNEGVAVQCDCQLFRKKDKDLIVLEILSSVVEAMSDALNTEEIKKFCGDYEKEQKGVCGFFRKLFKKVSEEKKQKYENYQQLKMNLDNLAKRMMDIKNMPEEQIRKDTLKRELQESKSQKEKWGSKKNAKTSGESTIAVGYKGVGANLTSDFLYDVGSQDEYSKECLASEARGQSQEQEVVVKRIEKVNELKKDIVTMLETYRKDYQKGVMVYLDDFYQITKADHPYIIQYLHDIYKVTKRNTFCFKLVTLPSSLKINYDNEVVFSVKDDFSSVYLDYDLSNLDKVQERLTQILIAIGKELYITKSDITSLFTNDETFKYLVIATGGIPRDFMTSFCEAIRISKRDEKQKIGKLQIYEVIRNLKIDKENNIEIDSELPVNKIEEAIDVINTDIVANMRTNVILYPVEKAERHEKILKNLTNLRYLHLIKQKINSEKTKQDCRAYLVDMTFYACGKISGSFNLCHFWEKDDASRLNNLRRAPVWSFSEEKINEILN